MLYDANKIVELNRNGVNNIGASSWRKQLSTIMNGHLNNAAKIVDSANWGNTLDVNPNINLLLTSVPELTFNNDYKGWIEDFLGNFTSGDNSKNKNSGFLGKLGKFAKIATNVGSAALNAFDDSSSTKTSQTFSPWVKNVQAWDASSQKGIEITTSFSFAMGQYGLWNAREEVVKPLLNLAAPTLLQNLNAYSMSGPGPNSVYLLTRLFANAVRGVIGGVSAETEPTTTEGGSTEQNSTTDTTSTGESFSLTGFFQLASDGLGKLATYLEDFVLDSFKSYTFTIQFGKFLTLNNMTMKSSKLQFSDQVDQYGYPIEGSCTLTMTGIIPISLTTSNKNTLAAKFGS